MLPRLVFNQGRYDLINILDKKSVGWLKKKLKRKQTQKLG
jgi:hypothetical protein